MGSQQQTFIEAMEQQCISIAKEGIICSLPCKTSVLAASNPSCGYYDKSKTFAENLKYHLSLLFNEYLILIILLIRISGTLLSGFDLLFILFDKPNEELDYRLSSHIVSIHSKKNK